MFCVRMLRLSLIAALFLSSAFADGPTDTRPEEGLRQHTPAVYALIHAKIVVESGHVLENATLVVRDGIIAAVGIQLAPPRDADVLDLSGKTIYPGLIDAFSETSAVSIEGGAKHWNSLITPELNISLQYRADESNYEKLRKQGVVAQLLAPSGGILKGRSALVHTSSESGRRGIWKDDVAQHLRLGVPRNRGRNAYPNSPMGAVALARQTFLDAEWYRQAWAVHQSNRSLLPPDRNDALAALAESLASRQRVIIDGANELYVLRAAAFAREFSLNAILRGSGQEYQRLDAIRDTGRSMIIPVNFPKPPTVNSPELAKAVELSELMHWELAPENPSRLDAAGVRFALTSNGLDDSGDFLSQIRLAVKRGLSSDTALRSLTTIPAELFGVSERLGTLSKGKSASFIVSDGELFNKATGILETWIDGHRFEISKPPVNDLRGEWKVTLISEDHANQSFTCKLNGKPDKLNGVFRLPSKDDKLVDIKLESLSLRDQTFKGRLSGKAFERTGTIQFSAIINASDRDELRLIGTFVWPDGSTARLQASRTAKLIASEKSEENGGQKENGSQKKIESKSDIAKDKDEENQDDKPPTEAKSQSEATRESTLASSVINYPLGAFGLAKLPIQPKHLVIKNATLWTCGSKGILKDKSILITEGKITAIGSKIKIPSDAMVIDAKGKHLSPGIIDCHSHMATDGGVNEGTQAITAEVRISDFIDCNDIDIYRQLAGGVTTVNVLHGSANPIGGQNQVLQLRWGELFDAMRFVKAPPGIKLALGENVKRSNLVDETSERYPQSRMGVEQLIRDAFNAAKDYQRQWERWESHHDMLPPRRDLELEALSQILRGERWVHCHSYRQDEILALLRTCEEFGIKIATFQHILEGYKVADAIARHGAMGSSFSDWWAYKVEAYDAIPYNGALMHHSGVVVSFNSDDQELARHLNHEAAKAIKYGNLDPEDALKFVTLNPARQLRIDAYVGSLEIGKQADLVLWSGPPLSLLSRCEQTWIDGRKYFDIQEDLALRDAAQSTRARLVQKVISSGQPTKSTSENEKPDEALWPREDIYCRARSGQ